MAKIHTLKKDGETIYPQTHINAVVDENGNTVKRVIESFEDRLNNTLDGSNIIIDGEINPDSSNPVMNKAISEAIDLAIEKGRQLALRDLYIAAGAEYNDTDQIIQKTAPWGAEEKWRLEDDGTYTYWEEPAIVQHLPKHYYLNGLGDITEEQMMEIYNANKLRADISGFYADQRRIRTNLPQTISGQSGYGAIKAIGIFSGCENLEVAELTTQTVHISNGLGVALQGSAISAFNNCKKMKYIQLLDAGNLSSFASAFNACKELAHVKIKGIKVNLGFPISSLISKESVVFIIQNATPTSAITITLHPEAYARLADDADIVAALEAQPLITLVSA